MNDKAIRSAKLTAAGVLDKARARTAVTRAGGQIAPSKYLPDVPRQVHADGGYVPTSFAQPWTQQYIGYNSGGKAAFQSGNHPEVPDVLYHGSALKIARKGWTDEIDPEQTKRNMDGQDFREFRPSEYGNYGKGIYLTDHPETANEYAMGIRAGQKEPQPYGQVIKLHVSMKQPFTDRVLRNQAWKDYIKGALTKYSIFPDDDRAARDAILKALDNNSLTVRGLFLRDTPEGTMVNQHGQHEIHDTIRNSGFDGIIAHRPDGSREYVAFKPEQVKSALSATTFDPNDPDMTRATGGRIGKAYGGSFGYVPQAALPQLRLAVAQPLPQAQPKGGSWLNTLTDLAIAAKKPEEAAAAPVHGFDATMPPSSTPAPTSGAAPQTGNMSGFYAPFKSDLDRLIADAPGAVTVTSGYRTPERQQELWDQNAAKYPDPEVRDNYVARPGHSSHNYGLAADLSFASPEVQQWVHDNAAKYNLQFRMDHEGWHVEPINVWELRDQLGPPAGYADGGKVTDNENFQSWFGNSVTHTDGQPHVFYTGTSKDKDFTSFNVGRHGAWFTRDPAVASQYAEQNDSQGYKQDGWKMVKTNTASRVIPAYVKAENPYTGEYAGGMHDNYKKAQSDWFDTLRAKGHDAWMPASQNGNLVVALKEPQQIKSIYNNGQFNPKQKHMGKAEGGEVSDDGITAYHGSPHDFDQFDIGKINTGEGAQSYGYGLYFAGNERVAKSYRNALSDTLIHPEGTPDLEKRAGQMALTFSDNTPEGALRWLSKFKNGATHTSPAMTPELVEAVSKKFTSGEFRPGGHMYKVKLNVGPHELLDWDKPMSEQHPNVQAAIKDIGVDTSAREWKNGADLGNGNRLIVTPHPDLPDDEQFAKYEMQTPLGVRIKLDRRDVERLLGKGDDLTGAQIHQRLVDMGNQQGAIGEHLRAGNPMKRGDKWASEALMAQGIKGIRYRDAGSRNMTDGDPTHNYVMFHHDPVKVTEKYAYGGEVDDPMFGHHNMSAKGVEVASGLGGIPMPSMAISKVAHPLENFGDVTLMAHPSMVTPSRDTNVWSADTYTGRQPRGDEEFSDPKAINRAMQADPNFGHMRDITYWHDATNSVTNADEMMKTAQLGVARGIDPKQHASFHDYVSDVRQKLGYEAYKNDHMPGLRAYGDIKRVLYPKDLFTSSGNRKKPVDYTLENVMKRMKGAAEAGAEGFNYGPGNFRAIHTPKFASMGQIKSDRGLIIPSEQMKPIKSQFEDAYSGLVEKLVQATGRKGFRAYDEAADALTDISKGRKHDWFGDVPPELVSQIRELGRHASKMPTEYFEAKSKRAIPLSAFPAALVPKSDPESARRLTEAGVKKVMTYGSPEERVAMYRSQPDLMFKNGGKAMALTRRFTKDGAAAMMALKSKGN